MYLKIIEKFIFTGELMNKYYGQSEKSPKVLYNLAKLNAPSIVIIDEVNHSKIHEIQFRILHVIFNIED